MLLLLYFLWIHLCTEALGSPAEGHLRTEASGSKGLGRSDSGPHERQRGRITAPSSRGSGSSRPSRKYLCDILPIDHLGWKHQGPGTPKSPRSLQLPEFLNPLLHKALRLSSCQPRIPNHSPNRKSQETLSDRNWFLPSGCGKRAGVLEGFFRQGWCNQLLTGLHRPLLLRLLLQVHRQPRQSAVPGPHDHPRPGERGQGVAPGEEPRPRRPEGG